MYIYSTNTKQNTPYITFKKLPKKYTKVDDYLIRGPRPSLCDLYQLKKEGVNQIYDFRHIGVRGFKFIEKLACHKLGIKYIRKPYSNLNGEYPTIQDFETIAQSVAKNGQRKGITLFHCNSGRHRTSHMSAFYEITKGIKTLKEVKKTLGKNFEKHAKDIIQNQVLNKSYYSRKHNFYNGNNPIKKIFAKINNRYADAIQRGHQKFMNNIFGKTS